MKFDFHVFLFIYLYAAATKVKNHCVQFLSN